MRKKPLSYIERLNANDVLRPDDVVTQEEESFEHSSSLVDGISIRSRKVVKRKPSERFKDFKVSDFSIASLNASGADSLLRPQMMAGSTFNTLDSIPEPSSVPVAAVAAAAAASAASASDSEPHN